LNPTQIPLRFVFEFSFKSGCDPRKVVRMKVAPNILIYLQENFHNFLRSLNIFPRIISTSVLYGKCFGEKEKSNPSWARSASQLSLIH
jgi:hypothetical protein